MSRLQEKYKKEVVSAMMKDGGYKNQMQVPRLRMIVLNIGLGEAVQNQKALEGATSDLAQIAGQRPVITRSKKSIAAFRLRSGMPIGAKVTLRGERMYEFFDRLVSAVLPRIRDFQGVPRNAFDGHGNYSFGLKEQNVFPEVPFEGVEKTHGVQVTIRTTAQSDKEGRALLDGLGMPFAKSAADLKQAEEMTAGADRASLLAHAKAKAAKTTVAKTE